jgi:hypothetical protein
VVALGYLGYNSDLARSVENRGKPMPLVPSEWNVVVMGGWNKAILTPVGIMTRLFLAPEAAPLIEVPVDVVAPVRVNHNDLSVMVDERRLVVEPAKNTFQNLADAMAIAHRAVKGLPETPLTSTGFNVRYKSEKHDVELVPVLQMMTLPIDENFKANGLDIARFGWMRSVGWRDGRVTITASLHAGGVFGLQFNFEQQSSRWEELAQWLETPASEVEGFIRTFFGTILRLPTQVIE